MPLILQFRQHINCLETFRQQYKLYLPPIHCKIEADCVQLLPVKTAKTCTNMLNEVKFMHHDFKGKFYAFVFPLSIKTSIQESL